MSDGWGGPPSRRDSDGEDGQDATSMPSRVQLEHDRSLGIQHEVSNDATTAIDVSFSRILPLAEG